MSSSERGLSFDQIEESFVFVLFVFGLPLVAAAAIAWVIHCPIVMLLHRAKNDDATTVN